MHCDSHATGAGLTAATTKTETATAGKIVEVAPPQPEPVLTRVKRVRVEITRKPAKETEPA